MLPFKSICCHPKKEGHVFILGGKLYNVAYTLRLYLSEIIGTSRACLFNFFSICSNFSSTIKIFLLPASKYILFRFNFKRFLAYLNLVFPILISFVSFSIQFFIFLIQSFQIFYSFLLIHIFVFPTH